MKGKYDSIVERIVDIVFMSSVIIFCIALLSTFIYAWIIFISNHSFPTNILFFFLGLGIILFFASMGFMMLYEDYQKSKR